MTAYEDVESHVALGDPVPQLAGFARKLDVLVASSRGAGTLTHLLHPSTTAALTDVISCPLIVVTKGSRQRDSASAGSRSTVA